MYSMTGYGRGEAEKGGTRVSVELTAVNRKQLDLRFAIPRECSPLEPVLREAVRSRVNRGCLTVSLTYELSAADRCEQVMVQRDVADHLAEQLRDLGYALGVRDPVRLSDLVQLPGVVVAEESRLPMDKLQALAVEAAGRALTELRSMQEREGAALQRDLAERIRACRTILRDIETDQDTVLQAYRDRLRERIAMLGVEVELDDERLAKEVAFYAERSDIAEEIVRLSSHFDQMEALVTSEEPAGKAMDFLCQEMGRESNTLSAKTRDAGLSARALELRTELGRIREQTFNVE